PPRMPPKTLDPNRVEMTLSFRFKDVAETAEENETTHRYDRDVSFYDVPGAAIEATHAQTDSIQFELNQCDVFIVFLPTYLLCAHLSKLKPDYSNLDFVVGEISADVGLGIIEGHLEASKKRFSSGLEKRAYPICFIISKFDNLHE